MAEKVHASRASHTHEAGLQPDTSEPQASVPELELQFEQDWLPQGIALQPYLFPRLGGAARAQSLLNLQRTIGNQSVQRAIGRSRSTELGDDLAQRIQAASSGGSALDTTVRARIEPGLGADLSSVRIHTDAEADQLSRSVEALAFTTGQDIFFRSGAYHPTSSQGLHLLAHEATHTVQQSAGPVAGTPAPGGVSISDPSDSFEQEAEHTANSVLSGAAPIASLAVARVRVQRQAAPEEEDEEPIQTRRADMTIVAVQRYQAGDTGHGGIEEKALTSVGFTADEASQVYFGNWLRDLSQLPDKKAGIRTLPVINILALGEFNRPVTQEDLGTYIPSEHLDNPLGGGTIEDRPPTAPAMADDKADEECRKRNLSEAQCKAFKDEEHHREDILKAASDNHLPVYIERGKFHAKRMLEQAIAAGPTPEGRALMGNALHAVEDYFSHSNFVEAAILTLKKEGVGGKKVDALVDQLKKTTLGEHAVTFDAKTGEAQIVTGTYAGDANATVSLLELIQTEIRHGQLTKAFMLGLLRQGGIGLKELGERFGEKAVDKSGLGVVGGIIGGIGGAIGGAIKGTEAESDYGLIGNVIGGLIGGVRGAVGGYRTGKRVAEQLGGAVGGALGSFLDLLAVGSLEAIAAALLAVGIAVDLSPLHFLVDAIIDAKVEAETKKSKAEAPIDRETGKKGPTHSELAKDSPDNPLFRVSAQLAIEVDKEFGVAMQAAWSAGKPGSGTPVDTKSVTDLVDKFVSPPSHDPWWRTKLLGAI